MSPPHCVLGKTVYRHPRFIFTGLISSPTLLLLRNFYYSERNEFLAQR